MTPPSFKLFDEWNTPCFERLTEVGWVDAFVQTHNGVRVGIRVNDPAIIPRLRERMPAGGKLNTGSECDVIFSIIRGSSSTNTRTKQFSLVYHNHSAVGRSLDFEEVLERFDSFLLIAIGFLSDEEVFLHAGVVAWRDRAIVIPGRTHFGKSTLVAALVKAGAEYVSDETALLRTDGLIGTMPKTLTLREPGSDKNVKVDLEKLGGTARNTNVVPELIVITRYQEGLTWQPKLAGQGETVLGLLDNAIAATRIPQKVAAACEDLARRVPAFKGPRGDADETAAAVLLAMDRVIETSSAA